MILENIRELFELDKTLVLTKDIEIETMQKDSLSYCLFENHKIIIVDKVN